MTWNHARVGAAFLLLMAAGGGAGAADAPASPGIAIIRTSRGMPGDAVREGAAEMLVLMQIARLQQAAGAAGLVAVGDRRGIFPAGAGQPSRTTTLHELN